MPIAQQTHLSDLVIAKIRRDLRRYAAVDKLVDAPGEGSSIDPFGVQVLYSKLNPHVALFRGVTHDNIDWGAEVDFRAYSTAYHDQLIQGIGDGIRDKRRERRGQGPIIIPGECEPVDADPNTKHPSLLLPDAAAGSTIH